MTITREELETVAGIVSGAVRLIKLAEPQLSRFLAAARSPPEDLPGDLQAAIAVLGPACAAAKDLVEVYDRQVRLATAALKAVAG